MGHELIGLLGGGIQAHRVVHRLVLGKREISVAAIHRAAGGIDQMLDALVAATLEHMAETHQIRLDVGGRVFDRLTHPSLGSQMDHPVGLKGRKHLCHCGDIGNVEPIKAPASRVGGSLLLEPLQPCLFEIWVVITIEVVNTDPVAHRGLTAVRRLRHQ